MADVGALLAAYDEQIRPSESRNLPPGVHAEGDGPIVRIVGQYRGFISAPADLALGGDQLDALIARQRDFFAQRGEAVEWKIRSHDRPEDLAARLRQAGFVPEPRETVLIGLAAEQAARQAGSVPEVSIRLTDTAEDMRRIAAMESEVWAQDWSWLADDLAGRVATGQFAVFVAEVGDQVVSSAWLVFKPGTQFAGLWGGATLAALARPGHLPCTGGPPGRDRRRAWRPLSAGRRLRRQPSHSRAPGLRGRHHDDALRLGPRRGRAGCSPGERETCPRSRTQLRSAENV